ncbi:DNA repair protein XRCC2-like [Antedon mediterranea]|uniref:DNA repair protein XRCC2-like n=1 Tax=Antedon mediterranea TaxID=105859 RepID=UPI003AF9FD12
MFTTEDDGDFKETEVETCAQLFLRLASKPSLEFLDRHLFPCNFPKPGEVIEIHGSSATGKTELLMNLMSKCILPKRWKGIEIDGFEAEVLFIDTDYKFSVMKLHQMLKKQLLKIINLKSVEEFSSSSSGDTKRQKQTDSSSMGEAVKVKIDESVLEELVKSSLDRLYLVKCSSTNQLLITLHSIEAIFSQHPQLTVLMLDNLSAFYWEDRIRTGDNWTKFEELNNKVLTLLQTLIKEYNLVLFLTKNSTPMQGVKGGKASSSTDLDQNESFNTKSWCKISNYRLILTRTDFPFPIMVDGDKRHSSFCVKVFYQGQQHQCKLYISSDGISYA